MQSIIHENCYSNYGTWKRYVSTRTVGVNLGLIIDDQEIRFALIIDFRKLYHFPMNSSCLEHPSVIVCVWQQKTSKMERKKKQNK